MFFKETFVIWAITQIGNWSIDINQVKMNIIVLIALLENKTISIPKKYDSMSYLFSLTAV